ncbi:MAG: hypothetical protein Q4P15_05715 [Propionibacteriaceae bacterium]|nr:hypothetical protein [Propionibacteriaceae bacterium]
MATPSSYVSTATVLLRWVGPNADQATTVNIRYLSARAPTYSLLIERTSVLSEALAQSGMSLTVAELAKDTESSVPLNSQTIQIRSRSRVPDHALRLVNATADALVKEIAMEEQGAITGGASLDAVVAVRGQQPSSADTPRSAMYVAVGALFGATLGLLIAVVLDHLRGRQQPRRGLKSAPAQFRARNFGLCHLAWASMIAATIPWRSNTFYASGADPVVLAKAGISMLALIMSFWAFRHAVQHRPLPAAPIMLLTAYLAVTVIGGLANSDVTAALVVAIRVVMLMLTIVLLVAAFGPTLATRSFIQMLAVLISISTVVGVFTFNGRLGGIMHPNALAFATAVVGVWLLSRVLAGEDRGWELFALAFCLAVVLLTGSRSSLAAFGVAALAMIFRITALRVRTLVILALCLPIITYVVTATDLVTSVFLRGGSEQVTTLSNRTIAWDAAINLQRDFWQTWFGQGLQQKKIPVPGQWWDTQLLDSSWISALVQGGNLGAALALVLGLATLFYAAFAPRLHGAIWLGLALVTTFTGILESGLLDGSLLFMVFWVATLGTFSGHLDKVNLDPARKPISVPSEKSAHR